MNEPSTIVKELADRHGRGRRSLLPILQGVVEQCNYLTEGSFTDIARELRLSTAEVYGTASFYAFLNIRKTGKYAIRVCKTITCSMKGTSQVLWAIRDQLKITEGETTPDNRFTLLHTNCLGWCHKGPAMMINDKVYTELTPEKVREILQGLP